MVLKEDHALDVAVEQGQVLRTGHVDFVPLKLSQSRVGQTCVIDVVPPPPRLRPPQP